MGALPAATNRVASALRVLAAAAVTGSRVLTSRLHQEAERQAPDEQQQYHFKFRSAAGRVSVAPCPGRRWRRVHGAAHHERGGRAAPCPGRQQSHTSPAARSASQRLSVCGYQCAACWRSQSETAVVHSQRTETQRGQARQHHHKSGLAARAKCCCRGGAQSPHVGVQLPQEQLLQPPCSHRPVQTQRGLPAVPFGLVRLPRVPGTVTTSKLRRQDAAERSGRRTKTRGQQRWGVPCLRVVGDGEGDADGKRPLNCACPFTLSCCPSRCGSTSSTYMAHPLLVTGINSIQ